MRIANLSLISRLGLGAATGLSMTCFGDGLPLVQTTHPDFVGSGNCAACHSFMQDPSGQDVSIDSHWRSTMMANSAKDPLWQAKVSSEVVRAPALQKIIEEKCATCHMPMARTQAKAMGVPVEVLGDGFLNEGNPFHSIAMDGVSCSLCHQITDDGLGEQVSFSGGYRIDTSTEPPDRPIYGPFPDPFTRQMQNNLGFTPVEGVHTTQSGLCGACHNLETPFVDANGTVQGTFPEQMTYMEWEHSLFNDPGPNGKVCQDCHMPTAAGGVVLSNRGGPGLNLQARSPFSQHFFVGGNDFMLGLLSENSDELKLTASTQQFMETRVRLISQMQGNTANLKVSFVRAGENNLEIGLQVSSLVGHKFPSGFPSRRAWIHLAVTDRDGHVIFESGRPDDLGRIEGNDADFSDGACEPHHQVISDPEQVQIYESIMENTDGEITYTLLRGAAYRKDNRLLPQGMDPGTADNRVGVYGKAAIDPDFTGGRDAVIYNISTAGSAGPWVVESTLYYQSVGSAFVSDLRQDSTPQISRFAQMYDSADLTPVTVASIEFSLEPSEFYHISFAPWRENHGPELLVSGPVGGSVELERSLDLKTWEAIDSFQYTTNPSIFEDISSAGAASRFYRLRWPLDFVQQ